MEIYKIEFILKNRSLVKKKKNIYKIEFILKNRSLVKKKERFTIVAHSARGIFIFSILIKTDLVYLKVTLKIVDVFKKTHDPLLTDDLLCLQD